MTPAERQPAEIKMCVTCAHYVYRKRSTPICTHNVSASPVDGSPEIAVECKNARSDAGECGREGIYWSALAAPVTASL